MNNNKQFEKFIRDLNSIRMSDDEKNKMRNNLEAFAIQHEPKPVQSPYHFAHLFKRPLAIALIAFLVISSTKPASASALPGEFLYSVKIMHEEIEAATKTSPEKKANFKIKQTETRIQEAIKLADKEELDVETQSKLAANIKTYTEDIAEEIKEIKDENPQKALEITSELKTTIKSNSGALEKVSKKKKKKSSKKKDLVEKTQETEIEDVPAQTEIEVETKTDEVESITPDEAAESVTPDEPVLPLAEENTAVEAQMAEITGTEEPIISLENETEKENLLLDLEENILLESLEMDLEFTETIEEEVKEEIIKNLDEKPLDFTEDNTPLEEDTIDELIEEVEVLEITEQENTSENTLIDIQEAIEVIPALPEDAVETVNLESAIVETTTEVVDEETAPALNPEEIITESVISPAPIQTEELIQNEIAALENVIEAKENLQKVLLETQTIMTQEETLIMDQELQVFIDNGQYGQAIIYIQEKIDVIKEKTQVIQIQQDLGITIDANQAQNSENLDEQQQAAA